MLVNSVPDDLIESAYHIAAHYLKQTGRLPADVDIHQPLLDWIAEDYRAGKRSKLVLANRAIARFEKNADVLEFIDENHTRVV
jgi:hypothetical protein